MLAAITLFLRSFITVLWKPQNLNTIFFLRNDEQKIYTFLAFAQSVFVVLQCSTSIRYVCNLALNVNSWKNYCTRRHGTALLSNVNCDLMRFRLRNFQLFYTQYHLIKVRYPWKILVLFPLPKKCAVFYPKLCILNFSSLGHAKQVFYVYRKIP